MFVVVDASGLSVSYRFDARSTAPPASLPQAEKEAPHARHGEVTGATVVPALERPRSRHHCFIPILIGALHRIS